MTLLRQRLRSLLNGLFWFTLVFYVFGGVRIHGRARLTYINDILTALGGIFLVFRLFFGIRFRDTGFGRAWDRMSFAVFEAARLRRLYPLAQLPLAALVLFAASVYLIVLFVYLPIYSHWHFANSAFDFGVMENAIYNGSKTGKFFTYYLMRQDQPLEYFPHNHLNFGLIFFALIYKFCARAEILLLAQSLALLGAMIPLYKLGDRLLPDAFPRWVPLILYWLWDPIHRMNTWDFHEPPFMIFFGLWALYFIEARKIGLSILFLFLMAIWKEDAWITLSAISFYAMIRTRRTIYAPLAFFGWLVLPLHAQYLNQVNTVGERYAFLGPDLRAALHTVTTRPWEILVAAWGNREFFRRLWMSTGGGVFLFSGFGLVTIIPALAEVGLSQGGMASWVAHYVGLFTAPVMFASILGWKNVYAWIAHRFSTSTARTVLACSMAICLTQLSSAEPGALTKAHESADGRECLRPLMALIPPDAPVMAMDPAAALLSRRRWIAIPFAWPNMPRGEWERVDQTEAQWLFSDNREFLSAGMRGARNITPWRIVAEACGFFVATR